MPRMRAPMAPIDYPAVLEEAWAQHLAPREPDAPTVISLFAGCGGSSLGYSMAGYRELLAVEWDDNAVATFKMNFPGVPVYHGDIHKLSVDECMRLAGISGPGELDVLDGSPPCQGFSTAGKREMADLRNQLYHEYVRLLRGLQPKAFVMENVSGLVKGKMKLIFADIMRELKASGYQVSCRLLNAMYFQVPQSRQRLIWIGMREGEPSFPQGQRQVTSVIDAIGHLPKGKAGPHLDRDIATWHKTPPGVSLRKVVPIGGSLQSIRLDPKRPAPTQIKSQTHWHYLVPRKVTTIEAALLHGYPTRFCWLGKSQEGIGNSVPPLFMRAIANHVRANVL